MNGKLLYINGPLKSQKFDGTVYYRTEFDIDGKKYPMNITINERGYKKWERVLKNGEGKTIVGLKLAKNKKTKLIYVSINSSWPFIKTDNMSEPFDKNAAIKKLIKPFVCDHSCHDNASPNMYCCGICENNHFTHGQNKTANDNFRVNISK